MAGNATPASKLPLTKLLVGVLLFLFLGQSASAECREDPRRVELGGEIVRLKSFVCREPGGTEYLFRVEFYRLSDAAASITLQQTQIDTLLNILGSPRLVETSVSKTYKDLLRRFGTLVDPGEKSSKLGLETPKIMGFSGTSIVTWGSTEKWGPIAYPGIFFSNDQFPALNESRAFGMRRIPKGYKYFYSCTYDLYPDQCYQNKTELTIWRAMRAEDVIDYRRRTRQYDRFIRKKYNYSSNIYEIKTPRILRLFNFVTDGKWPRDFVMIYGPERSGCGDQFGLFHYHPREVLVDFVLIESLASRGLKLNGIVVQRSKEQNLRQSTRKFSDDLLTSFPNRLAFRQKLLLPIKMSFFPGKIAYLYQTKVFKKISNASFRRRGKSGFRGASRHSAPSFLRRYIYGPEIKIKSLIIHGQNVPLVSSSANFVDLALSSEEGSCPYLLSFEPRQQRWVMHGKVLHEAPSRDKEYTEIRVFEGFRSRFRIEEREPEAAFIDKAELVVSFENATTLVLQPATKRLETRDGNYLALYWGDATELSFVLPEGVNARDVVSSELRLTGYYRRYSEMSAMMPDRASPPEEVGDSGRRVAPNSPVGANAAQQPRSDNYCPQGPARPAIAD